MKRFGKNCSRLTDGATSGKKQNSLRSPLSYAHLRHEGEFALCWQQPAYKSKAKGRWKIATASEIRATGLLLWYLLWASSQAFAGGYAVPYQTARAVGLSNAVTAGVNDPSAVYTNPAALTEIEGNQIMVGLNYINVGSSVKDRNTGRKSINRHDDNFLPTFFLNYHIPASHLTVGLGGYTPFGLATAYDKNAFTRFSATRTELKLFYLTPSIAWRLSPYLSVGAGMSFVHSSALLSRIVLIPPATQAAIRITDTTNAYTYNVGILYKPLEKIKLGFAYRGGVDLNFDTATVKFGLAPVTVSRSKGTQIPLPAVISIGVNYQITPSWTMEFVYDFTRWSEFKHLKARFNPPLLLGAIPGMFIPQTWKDTSTIRLGTAYRLNENLELRSGVTLDETPIPSTTLGPAIPGGDALELNIGLRYQWKSLTLDLGYMATLFKTRKVFNEVMTTSPKVIYEAFNNSISFNLRYRF
jgi:long-chain fatty acid transport protein